MIRFEANLAIPTVLTIAGFDPSSGAGVTADLAVFAAHGAFGCSAITALTVQSTVGVERVVPVDAGLLRETLACLEDDLPPAGIKIGMLGEAEVVEVVAEYLRGVRGRRSCRVVLDPVLRSSSGAVLLGVEGLKVLRSRLLPLVDCVTPNRAELVALSEERAGEIEEVEGVARAFAAGYRGLDVVVTGGDSPQPEDFVFSCDGTARWLRGEKIESRGTHGTGCAFSSALLCRLIAGQDVLTAAEDSKRYVEGAIRAAPGLGAGRGPMGLLWPVRRP